LFPERTSPPRGPPRAQVASPARSAPSAASSPLREDPDAGGAIDDLFVMQVPQGPPPMYLPLPAPHHATPWLMYDTLTLTACDDQNRLREIQAHVAQIARDHPPEPVPPPPSLPPVLFPYAHLAVERISDAGVVHFTGPRASAHRLRGQLVGRLSWRPAG
jgi:hypothetical protein